MNKQLLDTLRGAAILARQLELDDMADSLDRHIECAEHQMQVHADRLGFIEGMGGARAAARLRNSYIRVAPRGAALTETIIDEAHDWQILGTPTEDGYRYTHESPLPYGEVMAIIERHNREAYDDYFWRTLQWKQPHHDYGLPNIDYSTALRSRQGGKTTAIRALQEIAARNPSSSRAEEETMKIISFECHNGVHGSPPCAGKVRWRGTTVLCGCHCHHPTGYDVADTAPQETTP